jgi:hypothetical protein
MLASKARALKYALGLPTNFKHSLQGTNILAYYEHLKIAAIKSFIAFRPWTNVTKLLLLEFAKVLNKLKCLSLSNLSSVT